MMSVVFDYVKREKNCGLVLVGVVAAATVIVLCRF